MFKNVCSRDNCRLVADNICKFRICCFKGCQRDFCNKHVLKMETCNGKCGDQGQTESYTYMTEDQQDNYKRYLGKDEDGKTCCKAFCECTGSLTDCVTECFGSCFGNSCFDSNDTVCYECVRKFRLARRLKFGSMILASLMIVISIFITIKQMVKPTYQ